MFDWVINTPLICNFALPRVLVSWSFRICRMHKQPYTGVLRKRFSENMQQIYSKTPIPSNFIETTLLHGCSPEDRVTWYTNRISERSWKCDNFQLKSFYETVAVLTCSKFTKCFRYLTFLCVKEYHL